MLGSGAPLDIKPGVSENAGIFNNPDDPSSQQSFKLPLWLNCPHCMLTLLTKSSAGETHIHRSLSVSPEDLSIHLIKKDC